MPHDQHDIFAATVDISVALASAGVLQIGGSLSVKGIYDSLMSLSAAPAADEPAPEHTPATTVRKSLASPEHIISMIDGKPYKTLRRHLATHGLTPAEYRERYGLKDDYPIVAAAYATFRSEMAKKHGLGRKRSA